MAAYEYETHEYDCIVVGAGGAGAEGGRVPAAFVYPALLLVSAESATVTHMPVPTMYLPRHSHVKKTPTMYPLWTHPQ